LGLGMSALIVISWSSPTGGLARLAAKEQGRWFGWKEENYKASIALTYWLSFMFAALGIAILLFGRDSGAPWTGSVRQWTSIPFWVAAGLCLLVALIEWAFMWPKFLLPMWMRDGTGRLRGTETTH
jgi:hypothetical protein